MVIEEQKRNLRTSIRRVMRNCPVDFLQSAGKQVAANLCRTPFWNSARSVYLFCNMDTEIDTSFIFAACHAAGKHIAVPRITADKRMEFVACPDVADDWCIGSYGIREPALALPAEKTRLVPLPVLILVPGLAFTSDGKRLGQGGGYYDRFLEYMYHVIPAASVTLCGLCTGIQLVESLPVEPHDVQVSYILTEKALIPAGKFVDEKTK